MRYLSVTSGIEAATTAWHPLGWQPLAFSEIDPFPCKVLAHHYPGVENLGDMTKFHEWKHYEPDLLVGGTPCQSFSIAGLRKGLDDPRGNLMLTYLGIADRYKPRWLLFENVPGLLSSNGGRDFGTFLGALGKIGYGFAYRVLDAQFVRTDGYPHAVPQRRRRVFVVGHLGDWRRAAAVLFDSESLRGNPPPRRESGKSVTPRATQGTFPCGGIGSYLSGDVSSPLLKTGADLGNGCEALVTHSLRGEGFDASEDGTGCGTPIVLSHGQANAEISVGDKPTLNCNHEQPIVFSCKDSGADAGEVSPTLRSMGHDKSHMNGGGQVAVAIPIDLRNAGRDPSKHDEMNRQGVGVGEDGGPACTLSKAFTHAVASSFKIRGGCEGGGKGYLGQDEATFTILTGHDQDILTPTMQVRRLTPLECHRLQGFPDGYLNQVPGASDSAMYKALGNSMAVNCMNLIGQRIAMVDSLDLP